MSRCPPHPLDTKHPAIRETLRAIGRTHGSRGRRSAALTTTELKRLSQVCEPGLAGDRDRALLLVAFAGALRRAAQAGVQGSLAEPICPQGLRAGFVTTAYRNGVPDEEIMGHTRHRTLTTMRSYVRRAKLSQTSPAGKLGL